MRAAARAALSLLPRRHHLRPARRRGRDSAHVYATVVLSAIAFVLGFTTVFVILGATATFAGQLVAENLRYPQPRSPESSSSSPDCISSACIHIPILHREARYHADARPAGSSAPMSSALPSPLAGRRASGRCLARSSLMAAGEDTVRQGVQLLLVYSLGLGIPFIAAAFAVRPFMRPCSASGRISPPWRRCLAGSWCSPASCS